VSYQKTVLEAEHPVGDGLQEAWETRKRITDAEEHARATQAQSRASSLVRRVCSESAFGLLCPESRGDDLKAAIAEARAVRDEFNATATLSRLRVNVYIGRVAADDVEAMRAINQEVRDLLETMQQGVANLDVTAIRDAATKAKDLGQMLSPDAAERLREAISTARTAATRIAKAGEAAALEVDSAAIARLAQTRAEFIDLEDGEEIVAPAADGRSIDLDSPVELSPAEKAWATRKAKAEQADKIAKGAATVELSDDELAVLAALEAGPATAAPQIEIEA
jgi:hypothetical protein